MKIGIMQPYFLPYIGYFQLIDSVDIYVNLDHVAFMKGSYMTRNILKNETKINVNVIRGSQNKKCNEIYVNLEDNYISKFKKTLSNLYFKEINYEEIMDGIINPEFIPKRITISEFNLNLIKRICKYLEIKTDIIETSEGLTSLKKGEGLKEISKIFKAEHYINAIGGRVLYDKENFKKDGITLNFIEMGDIIFDKKYNSILDILFRYEKKSIINEIKKYNFV